MPSPMALAELRSRRKKSPAFVCDSFLGLLLLPLVIALSTRLLGAEFDGPAELPRVYVQSSLTDTPAPGRTIQVNMGGDLQAALTSANCGDTIALQAGAAFAGTFTLPPNPCDDDHWIIIRTSAPDSLLPAEGTRITPCFAGVAALPGRPSLHCTTTKNIMARIVLVQTQLAGPFVLAPGANHYRLIGLEITRLRGTGPVVNLIQAVAAADHIILDRVWLHGAPQDETRRGILLSGTTNVAIVDSFFTDFHCVAAVGTCVDSQAIAGGSSDLPGGPYKISNDFLEASGECILFGGDPSTTTAADIEIRHNHLFKPLIWQPGNARFSGGATGYPFVVKNHFELKNAQRVLFEGNILENNWGGFSQSGFSILLTAKGYTANANSSVNLCPICQVTDVTIRYSTINNVGAGFLLATALSGGNFGVPAMGGGRYSIHDVVVDGMDSKQFVGAGTLLNISNGWSTNVLNTVTMNHVTAWPDTHVLTLGNNMSNPQMFGFIFTNNIVGAGKYPVWSAGGGAANCAHVNNTLNELHQCFGSYAFGANIIASQFVGSHPPNWPKGNYFVVNPASIGFVDYYAGDYELRPSSEYKNQGTDGKDIGADIIAIRMATAGAD